MIFGRTELRIGASKAKFDVESDFEVRLAVALQKPDQISEKRLKFLAEHFSAETFSADKFWAENFPAESCWLNYFLGVRRAFYFFSYRRLDFSTLVSTVCD